MAFFKRHGSDRHLMCIARIFQSDVDRIRRNLPVDMEIEGGRQLEQVK